MKTGKWQTFTLLIDPAQVEALRLHSRELEDGYPSIARVIREAVAEYLSRHTGRRRTLARLREMAPIPSRAGTGKTPARIMLHLRETRRLELLRLHARTLKGTHRTVGRVIRVAIDDYLEAHDQELKEFLRLKRSKLGGQPFRAWKRWIERGGGP